MQELAELTLWQPDTLANLTVLPGSDEARKMTERSDRSCLTGYAKTDPVGLLVRMLLVTYPWASMMCLMTWKAQVTPRNRLLFRLQVSEPFISANELSLWPTLTASEWKGVSRKRFWGSSYCRSDKLASRFRTRREDLTHLNPDYAEAFMGFPMGWTVLDR